MAGDAAATGSHADCAHPARTAGWDRASTRRRPPAQAVLSVRAHHPSAPPDATSAAVHPPVRRRRRSRGNRRGVPTATTRRPTTTSTARPDQAHRHRPKPTVTRAIMSRSNEIARGVTRKVISASKSDGAHESGLTALIWNQVLSYGTDAMITVALAGTVFFGASPHAQRGNVLLYLLITMAPFAVVAPVIGPVLDRLQHGRRWTMAGTAIGRAVLAADHGRPSDRTARALPVCAGLARVVQGVRRGSRVRRAAARPAGHDAQSRPTPADDLRAGLDADRAGAFVGIVIKVTGSYSLGLWSSPRVAFGACGFFAFRLPKQVDSASPAPRPTRRTAAAAQPAARAAAAPPETWARKGFDPSGGRAAGRVGRCGCLSGLLTIYLAFYIESTSHGLKGALELGGVVGRRRRRELRRHRHRHSAAPRPSRNRDHDLRDGCRRHLRAGRDPVQRPVRGDGHVRRVGHELTRQDRAGRVIQRDVAESLRSSAFARSETFLQLAWVLGAAIAVLLPSARRRLARLPGRPAWSSAASRRSFSLRNRASGGPARRRPRWQNPPGNVAPWTVPSD